jgi:hypothetical protein
MVVNFFPNFLPLAAGWEGSRWNGRGFVPGAGKEVGMKLGKKFSNNIIYIIYIYFPPSFLLLSFFPDDSRFPPFYARYWAVFSVSLENAGKKEGRGL